MTLQRLRTWLFARHLRGFVDLVDGREVAGWAFDRRKPAAPLKLRIKVGNTTLGETVTGLPRPDVAIAHCVQGHTGFNFHLDRCFTDAEIDCIRVEVVGTRIALFDARAKRIRSSDVSHPGGDLRVNVDNVDTLWANAPQAYEWVRLDSVMTCNVQCVYCHNYRTRASFGLDDIERFIRAKVLSAENFQIGCTMEPTMDKRLGDLFEMVSRTSAKPVKVFKLATNGTLLHKHDIGRLVRAGLNNITLSIDTFDAATLRALRGGTDVQTVIANVAMVVQNYPSVAFTFTATVSRANIDQIDDFVDAALKLGVKDFVFQEIYYFPTNDRIDEGRMTNLLLEEGMFNRLKRDITMRYTGKAKFHFAHDCLLKRVHDEFVPKQWQSISRLDDIPRVRAFN